MKYVKSQKDIILNPKPVDDNVVAIKEDSAREFDLDSEESINEAGNEPGNERKGYTPINGGFGSDNL